VVCLLICCSLIFNLSQSREAAWDAARVQARASFAQDVLYRRWNAMHGGVYVPVSDETAPNPHLDVEHRDIPHPDGRTLTLVNPAFMTRAVHELGWEAQRTRAHITSSNPIRPENAPDPWEAEALRTLEAGADEVSELQIMDGVQYLRLLRPLVTEQPCLRCHADQGYQLGDVRGGISVSVPTAPMEAVAAASTSPLMFTHALLVLATIGSAVLLDGVQRRRKAELDRAQSRLLIHAARFEQMFTHHNAVKLLIDPDGGAIIDANIAAERFYGYPREHLRALRIQDINQLAPEQIEREMQAARDQNRNVFVFPHRLASGEVRTVEVHSAPLEQDGRLLLMSIIHDITEQARVELERAQLAEQLTQSQKMESIGLLAGGMAHDFNNMLAIILANAQLLRGQLEGSEDSELVDDIVEAATRSSALTSKLLAFARKGQLALQPQPLAPICRELVHLIERTLSKKIAIQLELDDGLVVAADKTQLSQALLNICMNGADAMPGGGTLRIEARAARADELEVLFGEPLEGCLILVSDTGDGMEPDTLSRAVEPFFTTKRTGRGTGLGLSVSHGIIHSHGGHLRLTSEPRVGTRAWVQLPLTEGAPPAVAVSEAELHTGHETLLLVDDEPGVLRATGRVLAAAGYRVLQAAGGREGLERYREQGDAIDLVLLDMMMPELDGGEVFTALRELDPEVSVLLFSGYSRSGAASALLDRGAKGFVKKPAGREDLLRAVRQALDADA